MFGLRNPGRRARRGTFSGPNVRNALIAGAGMLALKWWRNRQTQNRTPSDTTASTTPGSTSPNDAW
jgi:hypothetical protein